MIMSAAINSHFEAHLIIVSSNMKKGVYQQYLSFFASHQQAVQDHELFTKAKPHQKKTSLKKKNHCCCQPAAIINE